MTKSSIIVKGARQNNLKNINIEIPRDKLVVFTGLSGSGKSSLAIDTIYAEGQRRYLESLNTYARQFLGSMDKPDLDYIEGLSPSIAIEQKSVSKNPRSTVGTVTEIYDYLRLLYANIGIPHCPTCGQEITPLTTQEITESILKELPVNTKFRVLSPIIQRRKGEYSAIFKQLKKDGFVRVIVDEIEYELDEEISLDKNKFHDIDVVIDRLVKKDTDQFRNRLADAVEQASKLTDGLVKIWIPEKDPKIYSERLFCPTCSLSMPDLRPQLFSFNTPHGMCPACNGLGKSNEFTEHRLFPDKDRNLYESNLRSVGGFGTLETYSWRILETVAEHYNVNLSDPIMDLPEDFWQIFLWGSGSEKIPFHFDSSQSNGNGDREFSYNVSRPFEGILNTLQRRYMQSSSDSSREYYEKWMEQQICRVCHGQRLRPEALGVILHEKSIADVSTLTVDKALQFLSEVKALVSDRQMHIVKEVLKELFARYTFLLNVGLHYVQMDRESKTLSGGESERVRLATQIGSNLVGVLYVLDEPSIGLHPRDNYKLVKMLEQLRDKGNSILVVEHDEGIIRSADFIVDIGPGAGIHGGEVVVADTLSVVEKHKESLTGKYLRGELFIPTPEYRRSNDNQWITIRGARSNNLKNIDVKIPLGVLTVVTGVSGAGKSSLIMEILYKGLHREIYRESRMIPGEFDSIDGSDAIDKIIHIDQTPIGRTPRSIPATYTKLFDIIRDLFEKTQEAKLRGYKKGRFSFNVKGGRCEKCTGSGYNLIEMQFLPSVFVRCDVCKGQRYNTETLEVKFKGKNIAEVLDMSHEEAYEFFENHPRMQAILKTLIDVGLGYIKLGQSSTTLSGGEAQRVKLSRELSKRSTGKTLYILDEPTTGLHFHDTNQLILVIQRLVDQGNSVIIIEHNMDIIKSADYLIDVGPEGGDEGGEIVASGTPEEIVRVKKSYTGQFLAPVLHHANQNGQVLDSEEHQEMLVLDPKKKSTKKSSKKSVKKSSKKSSKKSTTKSAKSRSKKTTQKSAKKSKGSKKTAKSKKKPSPKQTSPTTKKMTDSAKVKKDTSIQT
ncbi:UvrABC system protein A [Candidatus Lokiarchaeum ossiferum]|uniref:UvrABC system protein A n=1 Tax=Candidatus Lokiarchaeum ossiferum TaxID=2951803 RepID=A0ABY6HNL4_9ARCH|nr:UvrABC system protein A [Candidatus Lokiarchaeum sp. B-35]